MGIQVLLSDLEPVAVRLKAIRETLDRAYSLNLSGIDPPYEFRLAPSMTPLQPSSNQGPVAGSLPDTELPTAGTPLPDLTLAQLARLIRERLVSPVEVTQAYLDRIEAQKHLRAFITVTTDRALEDAAKAEAEIMSGNYRGPLHGIPLGHKDLIWTKGIRTTYHSKPYVNFVPDRDAEVVSRMAAAGTVMLGKLNTYELGAGDGDIYGLALNPWKDGYQTGGSSSGSGTAVAAGLVAGATGTDAGGSIRVPAAFCGIVGLKPTYGWVSRYPEPWCTVASTGPMARTALDAAMMLQAMAGYDSRHQDSPDVPVPDFVAGLSGDLRGLRIGVPEPSFWQPIDEETESAIHGALQTMQELGATVEEIKLPHADLSEGLGTILTHVEAFGKYRKWLLQSPGELGAFFRQALTASMFYSANDYLLAQKVRRVIMNDFAEVFDRVDVVITPTVAYPAFRFGETNLDLKGGSVNPRTAMGRYTRLGNITGLPGVSVPCGFSRSGLPLALQITGRAFADGLLLKVAHAYQQVTNWHLRRPSDASFKDL